MGHNSVEDELEVRNLLARLARLTDIGTVEEYLEAFTDDAVLEIPGRPIRSGIEELRSGSLGGRETGATGPGSNTMHFLGATTVDLDGDSATAQTTFVMLGDTSTSPAPTHVGRYHDQLVRTPRVGAFATARSISADRVVDAAPADVDVSPLLDTRGAVAHVLSQQLGRVR